MVGLQATFEAAIETKCSQCEGAGTFDAVVAAFMYVEKHQALLLHTGLSAHSYTTLAV